jgi:DNA polymerase
MEVKTPISRLRGKFDTYEGVPLMPTFHPAYLLRNPKDKILVWADAQKVLAKLGLETE